MKIRSVVEWLDESLGGTQLDDVALNGLQVEACGQVEKVAVAVDASLEAVDEAIAWGADLLICHHGLFWGKPFPIVGSVATKLEHMFRHGLSLYASHLPLDAHPVLGNNACLARLVGLE